MPLGAVKKSFFLNIAECCAEATKCISVPWFLFLS